MQAVNNKMVSGLVGLFRSLVEDGRLPNLGSQKSGHVFVIKSMVNLHPVLA